MTPRRELGLAVGLCLVGAALILLALSRTWIALQVGGAAPLPPRHIDISGASVATGARALALLALAGVAALAATRRTGRLVVGALLIATGAGVVAVLLRVLSDPAAAARRSEVARGVQPGGTADLGGWPWVAVAGGVAVALAGLLVVLRGRRWATMSARYEAPATPKPAGETSLWDALDRGEDPTASAAADPPSLDAENRRRGRTPQ